MSKHTIVINGREYLVEVEEDTGSRARVTVNGFPYEVEIRNTPDATPAGMTLPPRRGTMHHAPTTTAPTSDISKPVEKPPTEETKPAPTIEDLNRQSTIGNRQLEAPAPVSTLGEPGVIQAPMPGVVLEVAVEVGQMVKRGDLVVRIEAMKMENDITATCEGVVKEIRVQKGSQVQEHDVLMILGD